MERKSIMIEPTYRHVDTWTDLPDQASLSLRLEKSYQKTFDFPGEFIDSYQEFLHQAPVESYWPFIRIGFDGWLQTISAMKLYELAYFSDDILELGTFRGLSSAIMSNAVVNSGRSRQIVTCDLSAIHTQEAKNAHEAQDLPGRTNITYMASDATRLLQRIRNIQRRFSLVFVDHAHDYEPMVDCCRLLADVTQPGAFVFFDDYNDPRNLEIASDFAVFQAVRDTLPSDKFAFWGVYGSCGLYRRTIS